MMANSNAGLRDRPQQNPEGDDYESALADPAAYYDGPETIVSDAELSLEQKKRFLSEWAQDIADRQSADQEGMAPVDPALEDAESDLLKRIRKALETLDTQSESDGPKPRRWWQRLRPA